jgi:hypothetical protein
MSDKRIQKLAKAVAKIIRSGLLDNKGFSFIDKDEEQELLIELAQAMAGEDQEKVKTITLKLNKS